MTILYIDDQPTKAIRSYQQDRVRGGWCFTTADGETIFIPFDEIKAFCSCCKIPNSISITTFKGE